MPVVRLARTASLSVELPDPGAVHDLVQPVTAVSNDLIHHRQLRAHDRLLEQRQALLEASIAKAKAELKDVESRRHDIKSRVKSLGRTWSSSFAPHVETVCTIPTSPDSKEARRTPSPVKRALREAHYANARARAGVAYSAAITVDNVLADNTVTSIVTNAAAPASVPSSSTPEPYRPLAPKLRLKQLRGTTSDPAMPSSNVSTTRPRSPLSSGTITRHNSGVHLTDFLTPPPQAAKCARTRFGNEAQGETTWQSVYYGPQDGTAVPCAPACPIPRLSEPVSVGLAMASGSSSGSRGSILEAAEAAAAASLKGGYDGARE